MSNLFKTDLGSREIFTRNLKKFLQESGKTQKEVADAVGVSYGTFCDWTKGRAYPRMDKVQLLADFFEVRKSDLVDDIPDDEYKEDQKVLDLYHQVPKEKREFVLSLIKATIDNL